MASDQFCSATVSLQFTFLHAYAITRMPSLPSTPAKERRMPTNQSELHRIETRGSGPLEAMHIFSERATGFTRVADWITEGQLLLASVSIMGSCALAELLWLVRALVYDLLECGKS